MDVALKIWRFDPVSGERVLQDYEVEAPEWACLLDVLDLIKDKVDGTLAYRKSCRMMICGSCGMRMVGDARDQSTVERLERYSGYHGIWDCTRCYFCTERCPKGVDPRDAIAKLGAEAMKHGIDRDMGAKHAKWFVKSSETTGWL